MNLFELEGESVPDSLIAGDKKGMLTRGIALAPGQGVLKRGTLLARNEEDLGVLYGKAAPEDVSAPGESGETKDGTAAETVTEAAEVLMMTPSGILTDDMDTGKDPDGDTVIATEYITGVFNPDAVIVKEGTEVRDLTETLRRLGIFFEEVD